MKQACAALQLTDVTVLPRPTREAFAEVSTNQVAAGVGVDTRLAVTFIGIWKDRRVWWRAHVPLTNTRRPGFSPIRQVFPVHCEGQ